MVTKYQKRISGPLLSHIDTAKPDADGNIVLCTSQLDLFTSAYHHILKLARTTADLVECEEIQSIYLAEALQYRLRLMLS